MTIGIDDLDFNEDDYNISAENGNQNPPTQVDENGEPIKPWITGPDYLNQDTKEPNTEDPEPEEEEDIITAALKARHIEDPSKIKFEDEEGNIEERDWNSLSREEQLNILNSNDQNAYDLDDSEIELINQLRLSQITPEEYVQFLKQQGAMEYAQALQQQNSYKVDDLSDDELFIVDLQSRVEDITEEEANAALERAKQDPALFQKQMNGIRADYKQMEEQKTQMQQAQEQQEQQEQFEQFKDSILDSIQSLDKIGQLDISMDDDDMNEVANFILSSDAAGVNYFAKALNDPETLVRMAWFALKGEEAIDSITEYFTDQIQEVSRQRYEQGLKDGREGKKPQRVSPVFVKPPQANSSQNNKDNKDKTTMSIYDLD